MPWLARYGLLISLTAVNLTFSFMGARADESLSRATPGLVPATEQTTIDQCRQQYSALRQDMEAKSQPIRDAGDISQGRVPANTICKLLITLGEAELRMLRFVEVNSNRCGISNETIDNKIRNSHIRLENIKGDKCKPPDARWRE